MWQEKSDGYGCAQLSLTSLEIFGTLLVSEKVERAPAQEFVYHADREEQVPPPLFPPKLDGIIAYLTHECNGNVHEKGIVNVTASGTDDGLVPQNVVDLKSDHSFGSRYGENQWICYDFKDRRVTPTGYTVKTSKGYGCDHLKSWVIEVSNDGDVWTEIDRRENNNDLQKSRVSVNFKISQVPSERFRFFRLRENGEGCRSWLIDCLEVFGTLYEK